MLPTFYEIDRDLGWVCFYAWCERCKTYHEHSVTDIVFNPIAGVLAQTALCFNEVVQLANFGPVSAAIKRDINSKQPRGPVNERGHVDLSRFR